MITTIYNNGVKTSEKVRGGNIAKISYKQQKYNDYSRRKDNLIQKSTIVDKESWIVFIKSYK